MPTATLGVIFGNEAGNMGIGFGIKIPVAQFIVFFTVFHGRFKIACFGEQARIGCVYINHHVQVVGLLCFVQGQIQVFPGFLETVHIDIYGPNVFIGIGKFPPFTHFFVQCNGLPVVFEGFGIIV